jgi:hypothetical protein
MAASAIGTISVAALTGAAARTVHRSTEAGRPGQDSRLVYNSTPFEQESEGDPCPSARRQSLLAVWQIADSIVAAEASISASPRGRVHGRYEIAVISLFSTIFLLILIN